MEFYDHEMQTWLNSDDIIINIEDRVDLNVDDLPDSNTREDDLNQLIDFKNSPAFDVLDVLDGLKGV